ncbi:TPA: hypothetical protein HA265_00850, partial [Candidatus Woesearchaeota archaeon]|nr:hypothetical protein [Candidatus Woesearchaeota archaeon]
VTAVDGAGNEGPAGVSNTITVDPTGQSCDRTPPRVWVEKSNYSSDITIMCEDDKSGCSSMDSYYGTSYTEPCEPFQYYLPPVTVGLFQSTIVCWNITDLAGNRAVGGETVILNGSAGIEAFTCDGGIDSDGDGFGERCNAGPDCDDTDPSIQIGCPNGCIMDLDGDGYGIGCDAGNDCNGRDETLTTECPNGCISDNDGDEYGLGCINGPDCKGDDSTLTTQCPNGCRDDNDGDQYGLNCPAGLDCNGEDLNQRVSCDNYCIQDTDGDGYGIGCSNGLDCNGADPMQTVGCLNGCTFDEDGDEYGLGCLNGPDCSGLDRLMFTGCPNGCEVDNDGDAHGWGCDYGADCDDTNTNVDLDCTATTNCIYDHDGDGFGLGCAQGPDCDDFSKAVTSVECTENCTYDADCNGLPDYWQEKYFNNTVCTDINVCGPDADPDGDGMSNMAEYRRGSDPTVKDEVEAPPIVVEEKKEDADEDGMPDACELRYGLNPQDPFDAEQDPDGDTLNNKFECTFDGGACAGKWLNPKNADTDNDGYADNVEFELNFDPCDPESHPSKSRVWLILFILGLLMVLGSVGYLIYKKYYIPLVSPPESPKPAKPVAKPGPAKPAEPPKHVVPTHLVHHPIHKPRPKPTGPLLSREKFMEEARRRAEEREKLFSKFGAKHEHRAEETMKEIARRPGDIHRVHIPHRAVPGHPVRPAPAAVRKVPEKPAAAAEHKMGPDHVEKLTRIIGPDYFDRISDMTKKEADYFGKLATIVKEKEIPLEKQYVDKLAKITKEVKAEGEAEPKEVTEAFRRTDIDKLDEFLNSRKKVTTFLKEYAKEEVEVEKKQAAEKDEFARLEGIGSGKKADFDALEDLSPKKRDDVLSSLEDLNTKKAQETALSKMSQLSEAESKEEIFNTFKRMSREKHVDKDVFAVLLDYMLKSGKITKHDVSELLLKLEEDGVLDKQDVASVFFSLGIKR